MMFRLKSSRKALTRRLTSIDWILEKVELAIIIVTGKVGIFIYWIVSIDKEVPWRTITV